MEFQFWFSLFLTSWTGARANDLLICRPSADAFSADIFTAGACKASEERIKVLEEQVRHLHAIVTDGTFLDRRARYPGVPADCGEIHANGTQLSGAYIISPDGRCPFRVRCDMTKDDGWTVIQRRIDGAVNFYRTWDEYVQGFGDVDGEYWLGLEKLHRLTKEGAEIYFHIENHDGSTDNAHYTSFTVHGITTLYKMNVDAHGYKGTLAELFSFHDNQAFSTFDRDNDKASSNCAQGLDGGGWWYKDCYRLGNPNGVYGKRNGGGIGYWTSKAEFVRAYTIKVRQRRGVC